MQMQLDINVYKVFTTLPILGNSAGVLEYKSWWSVEDMINIAKHSDTSVTVFVEFSTNDVQDATFRFFSKEKELSFCGHGTLAAAAFTMDKLGTDVLRVKSGPSSSVVITKSLNGHLYLKTPRMRTLEISLKKEEIASMLGIKPDTISIIAPFCVATVGSPKLMVPLSSRIELDQINPQYAEMKKWSHDNKVNGVYTYALKEKPSHEMNNAPTQVYARGFNPLFGILEDAATGVAAGALGDVLSLKWGQSSFIFHQGKHIGALSEIRVEIEPEGVRIGGSVVFIGINGFPNYFLNIETSS